MSKNIVVLTDVYELKRKKEAELKYYNEQLEILKEKMFFIQKEIDITNLCIEIIEKEKASEMKKALKNVL
jgi:prefoldin subunit 5